MREQTAKGFAQKRQSFSTNIIRKIVLSLAVIALLPVSSYATTITKHQNWEKLEFLPGQTFRNYSPALFNSVLGDWYVNSNNKHGYGVEHQHSQITWRQNGTNDDFLELDLQFTANQPQIYTEYSTTPGKGLDYISIDFFAAGRPDLHANKNLSLYGRFDGGDWEEFDSYTILGGTSIYPNFKNYNFTLALNDLFSGVFEFGFACTNCANTPGYGVLLGDVTARYTERNIGSSEVPEPATVILLGAALSGLARRKFNI